MTRQHIFKSLTDLNVFREWLFNKSPTHTHTNGPLSSSVCAWYKKGNGICWRGHVDNLGITGHRAHRPGRFHFGITSTHPMNTRTATSCNPDCPVSIVSVVHWMLDRGCSGSQHQRISQLRTMARLPFPVLNIKHFSQSESQCHLLEDYDGYRAHMCCNM